MNDDGKAGKRLNAMIQQRKTKIDTEYCLAATKMPKQNNFMRLSERKYEHNKSEIISEMTKDLSDEQSNRSQS